MLEIKDITLQRGLKVLLDQANATIHPRQRVGLIGKNGTGKSSLFALIKGEINQEKGELSLPQHWQIASVAQETPALSISAIDYVLQGDTKLQQLHSKLAQAEAENDGVKMAHLHSCLDEIEAYTAPARAAKLLNGLGFEQQQYSRPVSSFSGGWRMRLNLAQALMCRADLLLLDEPTNHLDLETVLWLENYLQNLPCTQIIISHDRDFLNKICTHTLELNQQKLHFYGGNYDFYLNERAVRLANQQAAYQKQQTQIKHLQSFIDRFKAKASKATQAQSRIKALDRLEKIAPAHIDNEFNFEFVAPVHLPNPLLRLDKVALGYGNEKIIQYIDFSIENGARLGLLGINGSGKSTLIKAIAGELMPLNGQIIRSDKLNIGYFAQHQLEVLRDDCSAVWHIQKLSPDAKESDIRHFLGGFLFTGDKAIEAIAPFSGGEKARLALAMLVWQKPNLLLLDEPTNHLDLDMRHALTMALQSFAGAMILVSHDRSLIEATTDQFLLINQGKLQLFEGDLNDYRAWRLAQEVENNSNISSNQSMNRKDTKRQEAQMRQERTRKTRPIMQKITSIEERMTQYQSLQQECDDFLSQECAYFPENKSRLQEILAQATTVKVKLSQLEEEWLMAQEDLEAMLAEIEAQFTSV